MLVRRAAEDPGDRSGLAGYNSVMADVTYILSQIEQGDRNAADQLLTLVYDELRKLAVARMAQENPGQTLQATALVHEAYVRLVDKERTGQWDSRGHFFAAAAEAMRRILVDRARDKRRLKRGGGRRRLNLDAIEIAIDTPADDLLDVNQALEQLAVEYPDCVDLVKLRFFAGMTQQDAAAALDIPRRTADRLWAFARAWLYKRLQQSGDADKN